MRAACFWQVVRAFLDLHIHYISIGLHQTVANLQSGLEADLRLLHGDHRFFQTDGRILQLHLALQLAGLILCGADGLQCALQSLAKTASR